MNIIKLNATPSTNDYLKDLLVNNHLEDFSIVVAEHQTKGKGQMGAVWQTEASTSLTFSVLLTSRLFNLEDIFTVNIIVANAIHKVLLSFGLGNLSVKWPNDIMSYNKKIGGILIENNIKADGMINSIIGIGLNVNQTNFEGLPQASSILNATGISLDKEDLMLKIVTTFKDVILNLAENKQAEWAYYHEHLFKKGIPVTFETYNDSKFTGIIINVNQSGQLGILNESNDLTYFNLKEIKMLY